jgi:hypothetical protein
MQELRNLTHFVAFADQFQDFKFTIAESADGVGLALSVAMREFCDHLCRHGRAKIRTSVEHFADCLDHIGHGFMFHHVAVRAGTKRAYGIERFIMHREHENR